jgi:hypothetical protein
MKILDIPQSGKRGLTVSMASPFGQVSRRLAIPKNPRSRSQASTRRILTRASAAWRELEETQRAAWAAAGKETKSSSRLGQSGALSGFQLFMKLNCTLAQFGQEQVEVPTARPLFPEPVPQALVITNTAGVIALKLTCPTDPGTNTFVRGAAPVSQGREGVGDNFRVLGLCPVPAQGSADITDLYTARFGEPLVGKKVFIRINQVVDGWEDLPLTLSGIVPAAA